MRQGGSVPFLITKMRQNSIDDVLVLDTRNHFDRPAAATADLDIDVEYALEPLCPGGDAESMAACCSAAVRPSESAPRFLPFPRLAGVTSPRQRWLGRAAQAPEHLGTA